MVQQHSFDMWSGFSDQFVEALNGFHGNPIVASFYGHQHRGGFRLIADVNATKATSANAHVGFVSSSLTPRPSANPTFTEYFYQPHAPYAVLDRTSSYIGLRTPSRTLDTKASTTKSNTRVDSAGTDLKEANQKGKLAWKSGALYSKLFGATQLDVQTMSNAIDAMHTNTTLFRAFFEDLRTYGPSRKSCDTDKCRYQLLCAMNNTLYRKVEACFHEQ